MTAEPAIRQTQCPSCGAPIAWLEGETNMRCPYCHVGLERTLPQQEDNGLNIGSFTHPQVIVQTSSFSIPAGKAAKTAAATAGAAACSSTLIGVLILVVVGAILAGIFLLDPNSPVSLNPPPLQIHDPFILVANAGEEAKDVIAMSYDIKAETYALGRLSLDEKKFLWRAAPVESISDVRAIVANETTAFYVEKDTQLKALNLGDGSIHWQTELVDKLGYGDSPLNVQGNRVVALTQDYTVQVFDATTGVESWSRRLNSSVSGYTLLTHSVAVIDTQDGKSSLFLLSLSDGSQVQRFTPVCERPDFPGWDSAISSSSVIHFAPGNDGQLDSGAAYFLYGFSPACAERWDIPGGDLVWRTVDLDNRVSSANDTLVLITPEMIFYGYDHQLWSISQATAAPKLLLENEDYEPLPLAFVNDGLIVRAKRTRGSERFELWRVDPLTGERAWSYNLGDSQPFQPPDEQVGSFSRDESAWDWRLAGDRLVLFRAVTNPNQFIVETLDLNAGTVAQTASTPIKTWSDDSYWMDRGVWQGPLYWTVVETKLLVLNTDTGVVQYSYP